MFVQNVLNDNRYQRDYSVALADYYIRLDVSDYEEAEAEFLKLLPEGVAATAFKHDVEPTPLYQEIIAYSLNAPMVNDKDTIGFCKTGEGMVQMLGHAYVSLTPDITEKLGAPYIMFMPSADDDMAHFIDVLTNIIMPYCQLDPDDAEHLICRVPSYDDAAYFAASFVTMKMSEGATLNENDDRVLPLTDGQGNSYGHMIMVHRDNTPEDVSIMYLFDDDLKANMEKILQIGFSKLSFIIAPAE